MKTPIDRNGWCFKLDEDIREVNDTNRVQGQGSRVKGRYETRAGAQFAKVLCVSFFFITMILPLYPLPFTLYPAGWHESFIYIQ
jgi:hypothetical protein